MPRDTSVSILFSALLLLVANSVGVGRKELTISRDNAVAGKFKNGKNKVSQPEKLLRNLRSVNI